MKILVIGGIAAGMSVAAKAKREDSSVDITVIEKEDYISFGACGLPYYLGGQFDDSQKMFARTPEQMQEQGVKVLIKHEALSVDYDNKTVQVKNLTSDNEFTLSYDRLVIATGARPIIPDYSGVESSNVYTFTRLDQVDQIKENLAQWDHISVIGTGFIGVEVCDQLVELGKSVTMYGRSGVCMRKTFDEELTDHLYNNLQQAGVDLKLKSKIEKLQTKDKLVTGVVSQGQVHSTDAVILAIGVQPATRIFKDPALDMLDNGAIVIDRYGRTSIKDVYAVGDCATVYNIQKGNVYLPLATSANKLGRLIGENITKSEEDQTQFIGSLSSMCIKVQDYEYGCTGLTEKDAQELGLNYKTSYIKGSNHTGYWKGRCPVHIKLVYEKNSKKILGAQVLGQKDAVTRMSALTTAIYSGLTTQELGFMDYAYAPPFATTWDVLNVAGNASK